MSSELGPPRTIPYKHVAPEPDEVERRAREFYLATHTRRTVRDFSSRSGLARRDRGACAPPAARPAVRICSRGTSWR